MPEAYQRTEHWEDSSKRDMGLIEKGRDRIRRGGSFTRKVSSGAVTLPLTMMGFTSQRKRAFNLAPRAVRDKALGSPMHLGMETAVVLMTALSSAQYFEMIPRMVDTLWFALGSMVTVVGGLASSRLRQSKVQAR